MRYRIRHRTDYRYSEPVLVSLNQLCLMPRETTHQRVNEHRLLLEPVPHARVEWTDAFGNRQVQCNFSAPHTTLAVTAESDVEVDALRHESGVDATWEHAVDTVRAHRDAESLAALQFIYDSPFIRRSPEFHALAAPDFTPGRSLIQALSAFAIRFKKTFTYDAAATNLHTAIEDVLRERRGVCQDFTQVMIAALRSHGLAARYVSGYLRTMPPPGQPRLVGADASHCWVSVYSPLDGWIDVDPTNGCLVTDQHITIAWGRDYADVTPVKGVILGGGNQTIAVSVDVEPEDAIE